MYIQINSIKAMKKMFILVHSKHSAHKICTEDLSKMYYFHKKSSPRLPLYQESTDLEESACLQPVTKKIKKEDRVCLESVSN